MEMMEQEGDVKVDVVPTPGDLEMTRKDVGDEDDVEVCSTGAEDGGSNDDTVEAVNEVAATAATTAEAAVAESERRVMDGEEVTKDSEAEAATAATGEEATTVDAVEGAVAAVAAEDGLLKRVSGLWRFFGRPGSRGSTGSG